MKDSIATNDDAASLTGDLLVRKGGATPSGFGFSPPLTNRDDNSVSRPDIAHDTPMHLQAVKAPSFNSKSNAKKTKSDRVRMTLRIDEEHHLRIRLTAAHLNTSLQDFIMAAIDSYLDQAGPQVLNGECVCLCSKDLTEKS